MGFLVGWKPAETIAIGAAIVVAILLYFVLPSVHAQLGVAGVLGVVAVSLTAVRYVASGFVSISWLPLVDIAMYASGNPESRPRSTALRNGSYAFSHLEHSAPLKGRVHLVTGGTVGAIGYWTAVVLARLGATVVITCRTTNMARSTARRATEEAKAGVVKGAKPGTVIGVPLELTSGESINALPDELAKVGVGKLHCVVHNAGILIAAPSHSVSPSDPEPQMRCNFVGTQRVADKLNDMLARTAQDDATRTRHVVVSSCTHEIVRATGTTPGEQVKSITNRIVACMQHVGSPARGASRPDPFSCYALSKFCNVCTATVLRRENEGAGVDAAAVHPGSSLTDIIRSMHPAIVALARLLGAPLLGWFFKSPLEACFTTVACCLDAASDGDKRDHGLLYWQDCVPRDPSPVTALPGLAEEVVRCGRQEAETFMCAGA